MKRTREGYSWSQFKQVQKHGSRKQDNPGRPFSLLCFSVSNFTGHHYLRWRIERLHKSASCHQESCHLTKLKSKTENFSLITVKGTKINLVMHKQALNCFLLLSDIYSVCFQQLLEYVHPQFREMTSHQTTMQKTMNFWLIQVLGKDERGCEY